LLLKNSLIKKQSMILQNLKRRMIRKYRSETKERTNQIALSDQEGPGSKRYEVYKQRKMKIIQFKASEDTQ
jgi:hypothetical protein